MRQPNFKPGDIARIRSSIHSPYSGHTGTVLRVDNDDERGPYLVSFIDGLQFRYKAEEIELLGGAPHSHIFETLHRVIGRQGRI